MSENPVSFASHFFCLPPRTSLPHFTSYSFACSKFRFAKHVKKSTFINRACDSTAHRAYQTRNRYTETLLVFCISRSPCPNRLLWPRLGANTQEALIKINVFIAICAKYVNALWNSRIFNVIDYENV